MSIVHVIKSLVAPSAAPDRVGVHWINTTTGAEYMSTGTSVVGDWKLRSAGGGTLIVQDEGTSLATAVTKINFAGAGVVATQPNPNEILVTVPGGGGGSARRTCLTMFSTAQTHPAPGLYKVIFDGTFLEQSEVILDVLNSKFTIPAGAVPGISGKVVGALSFFCVAQNISGVDTTTVQIYKNGAFWLQGKINIMDYLGSTRLQFEGNSIPLVGDPGDFFEVYISASNNPILIPAATNVGRCLVEFWS